MTEAIQTSQNTHQISTKFVPKENQIKWFHKAVELRSKSPTEIADALELDRTNFYQWMDDPGFREWWDGEWAKFYSQIKHRLIEAGAKNAETNHAWWQDMMRFAGLMKEEEAKPANVQQVNIIADALAKSAQERGVIIDGTSEAV